MANTTIGNMTALTLPLERADLVELERPGGPTSGSASLADVLRLIGQDVLDAGGIVEDWETATTGLTWSPSDPATVDSDTTIPDHLYVSPSNNAEYYGYRAFAPAGAFDARIKLGAGHGASRTVYTGLIVKNSDASKRVMLLFTAALGVTTVQAFKYDGGYLGLGSALTIGANALCLRITRDGGGDYHYYVSHDGLGWMKIHTMTGFSLTISHIGVYVQSADNDAQQYVYADWLRTDV